MTLRLILIRHAKSDWSQPGQPDHDRPLNDRGRRDAARLGVWLASRGDRPDQILCSTATRTRETLDHLLPALGDAPEISFRDSLYHAAPPVMLAEIGKATGQVVMVLGHNPGIAELARLLAHRPAQHPRFVDYPTAATTVFDFAVETWAEAGPGRGALRDFVVPDDL
jgi:phosphohistidine phosphatase